MNDAEKKMALSRLAAKIGGLEDLFRTEYKTELMLPVVRAKAMERIKKNMDMAIDDALYSLSNHELLLLCDVLDGKYNPPQPKEAPKAIVVSKKRK